ncbi:hypothetical protein HPB50_011367 [Hyalomma asiaticum]|uniref:Uncharacterized protein n=1 Tax=Hyalomma asiaticum TaxID=266040 RepID=A0ACB7RIS3_HYAAI|nr:hypothetical protein HPB50_011367 [Hyalomma asiaticum]
MPAGVENPADYYKNVAFSPTSVNGDGTKPTGDACQGTGKVASEKTGKRASDGDKAFVESKKPRLEDSSELEDVKVPRVHVSLTCLQCSMALLMNLWQRRGCLYCWGSSIQMLI